MTKYTECFACRLVECNEKDCRSPHCYAQCRKKFTPRNVVYDWCRTCKLAWTNSFKRMFRDMKIKLRVE